MSKKPKNRAQRSKKRRRPDDHDPNRNVGAPPAKKMRLKKQLKDMTVSELKKAIKKRDKNRKLSKLKKADLKSILFEQTRLTPSQIQEMSRKQLVKGLKNHDAYKGKSSWNKTDLSQYLEYINSDPNALDNLNHNVSDKTEITKDEFIKIPLFKLQSIYKLNTGETNRDRMYRTMQKVWKSQRERQKEVEKLLEPIIAKFFITEMDGTRCIKCHINADTEKVLVFRELDSNDRMAIRQFAEKNELFSTSVGNYEQRIIGVGLVCDQTQVTEVLREEEDKLEKKRREEARRKEDALRAEENEKWKEMIEKNALSQQEENDIFGEWVMKEDFGYGDKDKYYLYFNEGDLAMYGSFLIGPIEGKLKIKQPAGGPPSYHRYLDRKLPFDWRGRETGENVLQIGGNKTGEITFSECGTLAEGVLHSDYGAFEFHALKISEDVMVSASESDFDYDEEEMYEKERASRWG